MQNTLLILGFGNQARAWALNLRDSRFSVSVALRTDSPSTELVKKLGFPIWPLSSETLNSSTILCLTPDHTHYDLLKTLQGKLPPKGQFIFAHGMSVVSSPIRLLFPEWDYLLLAPKAIASEVRFQYETEGKLGGVYSVEFSKDPLTATALIKELAIGLGITCGPFETSFQNETTADLFSEQSLLCSLIPYGARLCYEKLRAQGIEPELAYLESWCEVRSIVDTLIKLGPKAFFQLISPNALLGSQKGVERLMTAEFQRNFQGLLDDINSNQFLKEVQAADFEKVRASIQEFWGQQELSQVHERLKHQLYT